MKGMIASMTMPDYPGLDDFLRAALAEDIGTGDITTSLCVPENMISKGNFIAKETGVICGLSIAGRVFELLDDTILMTPLVNDGDAVSAAHVIAEITGPSRPIITGERLALNLLQHLSGVATQTASAVRQVDGTKVLIKDTRKTTPGLRMLEKYAVKCGGGTNHRCDLAIGILIKDNHIKAAGSISAAIKCVKPTGKEIEVETETLSQVKEALDAGADIIMLDNMSTEMMAEAVKMINGRAKTEASGNMGERYLKSIAETGVDYISIGALTHSVTALDISFRLE